MDEVLPGLAAACLAIRAHDPAAPDRLRAFVSQNWTMVTALERLAEAEFAAGAFASACRKLEMAERLAPNVTGFFLRRIAAGVRAGEPGLLEELAAASARLEGDGQLFIAIEELTGGGRPDLARDVIAACRARGGFSDGMLTAAESRVLSVTGRLAEAIALLSSQMVQERPPVLVLRLCYLAMEHRLDLAGARRVCEWAVLLEGEEWDLRHAVDRMLFAYDFDAADRLLAAVQAHGPLAGAAGELAAHVGAARAQAQAAELACGPVEGAAAERIHAALSTPGTPEQVLWGRMALVSLLGSPRFTPADYGRFAWYLPNWEDGQARNLVLAAAQLRFAEAPAVRAGWLHYLITHGIYADAARFCAVLLEGEADEDCLFYVIALLRLHGDGMVHPFMDAQQEAALRAALLARMPGTGAGFRCVMHDHVLALGGGAMGWPADGLPAGADGLGLRRLFAVTTGRLARVGTQPPAARTAALRPVLAVSGQLRGFETAWASIAARLGAPAGAPVVVSVWDRSVNATGRHARRLERALPDDVVAQLAPEERYTDAFERAYPETHRLLFGETVVEAAAVRALVDAAGLEVIEVETESEAMVAQLLPPHISANMLKMYYKFARLEALIREAEARSGALFSHVVWSRPDCLIERLTAADLLGCLARADVASSSFVTENTFGDYVMVLPRRAFAALAGIFGRVVTAGHTRLLPWRPNRSLDPERPSNLDGFGGPDVIFDVLLAAGYMPLGRIPRMTMRLVGRTPGEAQVRAAFAQERAKRG